MIDAPIAHDDLATELAEHLRGTGDWLTFNDLQMGSVGSLRPDVLAIGKTYSRLDVRAYEVKVSRADFRRDATAGKWQGYLKFASSVTFAAPTGIIDPRELPATCGLIVRQAGGWKHTKKPVCQHVENLPWTVWLKLLMDGCRVEGNAKRLRNFSAYTASQKLGAKFGKEVADMLADLQGLPNRLKYAQENADAKMEAMRKRTEGVRAAADEQMRILRASMDYDLRELATLLGVETPMQLQVEVRDLVRTLKEGNTVRQLVRQMDHQIEVLQSMRRKLDFQTQEQAVDA